MSDAIKKNVPLKAYICVSDDHEHTKVVFAKTNGGARFPFMSEFDLSEATVKRAPQFDQYTPGPVPVSALLDDGWNFECGHCYRKISLSDSFMENLSNEDLRDHAARQAPYIAKLKAFDAENPKPKDPDASLSHAEIWKQRREIENWHSQRHRLAMCVEPHILSRSGLRISDENDSVFCDTRCEQASYAYKAEIDHQHVEAERMAETQWPGCSPYTSNRWPYVNPRVLFKAPGMIHHAIWAPGEKIHITPEDDTAWQAYLKTISKDDDGQVEAA